MKFRHTQNSGKKPQGWDFALKQTTTRIWTSFRLPGFAPLATEGEAIEGANAAPESDSQQSLAGTFFESGAHFEGVLKLEGNFRIDNDFRGELTTDGTVVVGASGTVEGDIHARQIEIEGAVVGNITARRLCILRASGRLHGDVETACLEIERHAFFKGDTMMTSPLTEHASSGSETESPSPSYAAGDASSPISN